VLVGEKKVIIMVSNCCHENKESALTWDVSVSDTLVKSYVHEMSQTPGVTAEVAAKTKSICH